MLTTRTVLAGIVTATVLGALVNFVAWPVAAVMGLAAGLLMALGTWWFQRTATEPDFTASLTSSSTARIVPGLGALA